MLLLFADAGLQIFHYFPIVINVNTTQLLISIQNPLELTWFVSENSGGIVCFLKGMEHLAVPLQSGFHTLLKSKPWFTALFVTKHLKDLFSAVCGREVKIRKEMEMMCQEVSKGRRQPFEGKCFSSSKVEHSQGKDIF